MIDKVSEQQTSEQSFNGDLIPVPLDDVRQCRICLETHSLLVQPCYCNGSIGWVHETCISMYASKKLEKQLKNQPKGFVKYRCQLCHREVYFRYHIQLKLNCNPMAEGKRFSTWLTLLVLLVIFGLLQGLLLIMIIVYYSGFTESPLFAQGKIWVIITITPLLGIAQFMIGFYFVCENLYGIIKVGKPLGRGDSVLVKGTKQGFLPLAGYIVDQQVDT